MSAAAIIRTLLVGSAGVTAQVPAKQIFNGWLPLGTQAPALGVTEISGFERQTVSMAERKRHRIQRVQVTIQARTYLEQKTLLELVRAACKHQTGPVVGFWLMAILPGGEGPDGGDADPGLRQQSIDFIVHWRAA